MPDLSGTGEQTFLSGGIRTWECNVHTRRDRAHPVPRVSPNGPSPRTSAKAGESPCDGAERDRGCRGLVHRPGDHEAVVGNVPQPGTRGPRVADEGRE